MHCSLFNADYLFKNWQRSGLHLTNSKVEIPATKTAIHPWITGMLNKGHGKFPPPLEEGSGMKPLWLTSIPPADLEKGQGAGAMSKPANHKVKRARAP